MEAEAMGKMEVENMETREIVEVCHVVREAIEGRVAALEHFEADHRSFIKCNGHQATLAFVDHDGKRIFMAAYGHGESETDWNDRIDESRNAIRAMLEICHDDWAIEQDDNYHAMMKRRNEGED